MMDSNGANGSVVPAAAGFSVHQQLTEATRLFQQNSYQTATASPFSGHMNHQNALQHQHHAHAAAVAAHHGGQSQHLQHNAAASALAAMSNSGMGQLGHGLSGPSSQSLAAALFANSSLISDDLKLAAAAAAAAAQSARGKKTHRSEPVPQSGFKGVSWNSRMKAWLAFYVTENGERKSKTFSTRKLGMEEARLQAIAFCKQKQDQRREARKRNRELQSQHCNGLDKLSSDESMLDSPASGLGHLHPSSSGQSNSATSSQRCGYPTTPGMGMNLMAQTPQPASAAATSNGSEIAYVPIVPIAMDMIEKSGLLQPLELNVLPPCQHCNKQPYPFLMIVSEGQEQTYSGSSIMSLASHTQAAGTIVQQTVDVTVAGMSSMDTGTPTGSPQSSQGGQIEGRIPETKTEPYCSQNKDDHLDDSYGLQNSVDLKKLSQMAASDDDEPPGLSPSTSSSDNFSPQPSMLSLAESQRLHLGHSSQQQTSSPLLLQRDQDRHLHGMNVYSNDDQLLSLSDSLEASGSGLEDNMLSAM